MFGDPDHRVGDQRDTIAHLSERRPLPDLPEIENRIAYQREELESCGLLHAEGTAAVALSTDDSTTIRSAITVLHCRVEYPTP